MLITKEQFILNIKHLITNTFYKDEWLDALNKKGKYDIDVDTYTYEDEDLAKEAAIEIMDDWNDADTAKLKSAIQECIGIDIKSIRIRRLFRIITITK